LRRLANMSPLRLSYRRNNDILDASQLSLWHHRGLDRCGQIHVDGALLGIVGVSIAGPSVRSPRSRGQGQFRRRPPCRTRTADRKSSRQPESALVRFRDERVA
jgi:hypothetical protein